MGAVLGYKHFGAENRMLNTPSGDLDEGEDRISDYLQKIKSEGIQATSGWAARDVIRAALAAGLPPPPVDMTAGVRARVPEEMFPPVLVSSNNDVFPDFAGGYGWGTLVSQAFRDAVETFDMGVHQFVPVEILRKNGGQQDKRPFYILRVTRFLDTVNVAASPNLPIVGGNIKNEPITDRTPFHLNRGNFAVFADRIQGVGLWRDVKDPESCILASQALLDLLLARKITGWRADGTFSEL